MENRRTFLMKTTLAAGVGAAAAGRALGANETVNIGLIGGRNQGFHVARRAMEAGARIKTFCDIDEAILARRTPEIEALQNRRPERLGDYRRVLDDKDVDAVVIAAPDHWHTHMALMACQAGKDVYVEKPLSQTIAEGHMIREAARKYDRVVQVGTQRRSAEHFQQAAAYVASGKLGKLCMIKAWMCQTRKTIGNPPDSAAPATVDYDAWLGPAPKRPFNENRFHYNWRFFWDYGNSELGNQGVHLLDVAMMAIQKMRGIDNCLPERISCNGGIYWLNDAKEVPDTQVITYDFVDFLLNWELRSFGGHHAIEGIAAGTSFHGTDATLVVGGKGWKVYDRDDKLVEQMAETPLLHEKNFLDCVKSRKRPNSDIEIGRLSTTICHLGNIAHQIGRDTKFDPRNENFGSDQEANAYLRKQYRDTYPLPKV